MIKRYLLRNSIIKLKKENEGKNEDMLYNINGINIWMPYNHRLPEYQSKFKNYDKKLLKIVCGINHYFTLENPDNKWIIIDIGANIGDSAALIRSCSESHIVCIEGDQYFLKYLRMNSNIITDITIIDSFIRGGTNKIFGIVERKESTSCIRCKEIGNGLSNIVETKTFQEIIVENKIDLVKVQLIKIDTDGYDFNIILSNKSIITEYKPNLYFEYDINLNANDISDSIEIISFLSSLGYNFILYDNFGNLLTSITDNYVNRFSEINHYLKSCHDFGGGINYVDVFATTNINIMEIVLISDIY